MPSHTLYPVLVHMSNPRLYFNYFLLFALHAHNSWFISTSYAMSTSILITFMFMVPGRLLRRDVPLVHRYPTVTSGDPTPSTRLPLDEGRKSQACTSLPSRTVFLPLSIELVHLTCDYPVPNNNKAQDKPLRIMSL